MIAYALALLLAASNASTSDAQEAEAHAIGQRLRCPVCQGMPISESPSEMAQAMMARVREMQTEGKSRDEIIGYFTQRYGEWVLLDPRKEGVNVFLWALPPVALLAGLFVLRRYTRRDAPKTAVAPSSANADDPYLAAIRREVDR